MNISSMYCISHNWLRSTRVHLYIISPNGFQDGPGVESCLVERSVTMHGRDTEQFDAWVVSAQKERICILIGIVVSSCCIR